MKLKLVPTAAALAASLMMGAALASGGASGPTVLSLTR